MKYRNVLSQPKNCILILQSLRYLLGVFLIASFATASNASILLNGSFESPTIPQNSFQVDTPASWSWSAAAGLIFNGTVSDWPTPRDGQQYVDIGNAPSGSGSLFQSFTITNGGTYELTWSDAAHATAPGALYSVSITDNSSQTIASQSLDAAHGGSWQDRSLWVDLVTGTYMLSFTTESGPAYDTVIDNVALTVAAPVSVPVPATFWLFAPSLAGLGFIRKAAGG